MYWHVSVALSLSPLMTPCFVPVVLCRCSCGWWDIILTHPATRTPPSLCVCVCVKCCTSPHTRAHIHQYRGMYNQLAHSAKAGRLWSAAVLQQKARQQVQERQWQQNSVQKGSSCGTGSALWLPVSNHSTDVTNLSLQTSLNSLFIVLFFFPLFSFTL